MQSSSGSATAAPAPRRKVRRSRILLTRRLLLWLLEQFGQRQRFNDRAQPEVGPLAPPGEVRERGAVVHGHSAPQRVGRQLLDEGRVELVEVRQEQLLELRGV